MHQYLRNILWLSLGCVACGTGSGPGETTGAAGMAGAQVSAVDAGRAAASSAAGSGGAGTAAGAGAGGQKAEAGRAGGASSAGAGAAGAAGQSGQAGHGGDAGSAGAAGGAAISERFSFFVTSVDAMRKLSKSADGFGGDLRFGKKTGLEGADEICRQTAELALPGSGAKGWRAFLSTTAGGPNGGPVHAKDRIGDGPWYDRLGRLVAANKADLLQERPRGGDPAIVDDLPNENGIPNHRDGAEDCTDDCPDNHQVLTGTNEDGMLYDTDPASTCNDWTSKEEEGMPWCGHSWPREVSGLNWMSAAADGGCAPCVSLVEMGGVRAPCVGSAGGYGGFYCFASQP